MMSKYLLLSQSMESAQICCQGLWGYLGLLDALLVEYIAT